MESNRKSYIIAAVLLLSLQICDLLTTWWALSMGGTEVNPISAFFIEYHLIVPLKLGLAGLILWGALAAKQAIHIWSLSVVWFICGLYTMVVVMNLIHIAIRLWA